MARNNTITNNYLLGKLSDIVNYKIIIKQYKTKKINFQIQLFTYIHWLDSLFAHWPF